MAKQALRNIALAYTDLDDDPKRDWESDPKPDETEKFILIGFLGIEDPVRPEVPEAVRQCQKAGIKVNSCGARDFGRFSAMRVGWSSVARRPFASSFALPSQARAWALKRSLAC